MDIKDIERKRIEKRLADIEDERIKNTGYNQIVIVNRRPVVGKFAKEFRALLDMLESLDNGTVDLNEYLEKRALTELTPLNEAEKNALQALVHSETDFEPPVSTSTPDFKDELGRFIDAYADLGLSKEATKEQIDAAHTIIVNYYKKAHDRGEGTDEMLAHNIANLDRAHKILTKQREEYDKKYEIEMNQQLPEDQLDQEISLNTDFKDELGRFIDAYAVLGCKKDATEEQINGAYTIMIGYYENLLNRGLIDIETHAEFLQKTKTAHTILIKHRTAYDKKYDETIKHSNGSTSKGSKTTDNKADQQDPNHEEKENEDLEDLIEVEKVTPWNWIKSHKHVFVAVGVTVLAISAAAGLIAISQMAPALIESTNATQVARLANRMIANGQAWAGSAASQKLVLQGANAAAADTISSITGISNNLGAGGIWKFGGQTLSAFAESAAAKAAAAATTVSKLETVKTFAKIGALAGAIVTGPSLLIPKKKTKEYYNIKKEIERFKEEAVDMTREQNISTIQMLSERILTSTMIEPREKDGLLRKLQKAARKVNDMMSLREGENLDVEDTHEFIIGQTDSQGEESLEQDGDVRIYGRSKY